MRTVSREELYEQVWAQPTAKVAAEYGITGTALKKTCVRHNIPTPERGYWAKIEHGKPVRKKPLLRLADNHLDRVQIARVAAQRVSEEVRKARIDARERLELLGAPELTAATALIKAEAKFEETSTLSATRRALSRVRPDEQGFVTAQGRGIVPLKIAPKSIDRALRVLTQFFALVHVDGYRLQISDTGLVLTAEHVSIGFGLEEQPQKTLHVPTAAELKRRDDDLRWGSTRPAWPKYDYSPSGRLAIVIHANSYSGLRRTYSDGKTQSIEAILPTVVAGLAEHAALIRERRLADDQRECQRRRAETRRRREETFNAQEKRRVEFVDAIHEQLVQRSKLLVVLAHLENFTGEEASLANDISAWIRRRVQQIDALTNPHFLDISARSAAIDFAERTLQNSEQPASYFGHLQSVELQFWSIDKEKGLATSITSLEWAIQAGAVKVDDSLGLVSRPYDSGRR